MIRRVDPTRLLLLLLPVVLLGCSSAPPAPHAMLDERSGVTVNAVSAPFLFVRVHSVDVSDARDFITLVAAENDNAGKYTQLFLMYRWSTAFHGLAPQPDEHTGRLVLVLDGREVVLEPLDQIPLDLSRSKELFVPEGDRVRKYAYQTDFDTMRAVADSHDLVVKLPQEQAQPDAPFTLWHDGRPALAQLVNQLNGS